MTLHTFCLFYNDLEASRLWTWKPQVRNVVTVQCWWNYIKQEELSKQYTRPWLADITNYSVYISMKTPETPRCKIQAYKMLQGVSWQSLAFKCGTCLRCHGLILCLRHLNQASVDPPLSGCVISARFLYADRISFSLADDKMPRAL